LTGAEAVSLLTASNQWKKQIERLPDPKKTKPAELTDQIALENSHVHLADETKTGTYPLLQREEMQDDRTSVDKSKTATYHYNTIGFLNVNFPSSSMRSTGFLIGPNLVLTNAHNIYSFDFGGWYEKLHFSPGQFETEWPIAITPFSTASPVHVEINDRFFDYEKNDNRDMSVKYDYAALFFAEPFNDINTFMPLEFNYIPDQVGVLGYPGVVRGTETFYQWRSEGTLIDYNEHCLALGKA